INEPTAAALSYGLDKKKQNEMIAVYDLGGGTFDVTILKLQEGFFKVLATDGDSRLGGDDFDQKIVDFIVKRFQNEEGVDLRTNTLAMQKILETSEKIKIELSDRKTTEIMIPFIIADSNGTKNINYKITRVQFEEMIKDVISRTVPMVFNTLNAAGLEKEDIDRVILVGGSTKIPFVQKIIEMHLGKTPYKNINPDECVALGAAIAAGIKSQQIKKSIIRDVLPQPLGTDIDDDVMDVILDRNTPLPARHSKIYTTTEDFQTEISIMIYQGTSKNASENQILGEYMFSGIEKKPAKVPSIEITFKIDVNGILNVSAKDHDSGKEMDWTVKRDGFTKSLPEEDNNRKNTDFVERTGISNNDTRMRITESGNKSNLSLPPGSNFPTTTNRELQ
ncbi:Hsp70 family protein, partial [bacterium]|nr:Hsp70 family protein [bacterium]